MANPPWDDSESDSEEESVETCREWFERTYEETKEKLPDWTEPVLKSSLVPFAIFWGAFLVSAIGITGSILSVDTTVGNMMNITAQLGTQEVRYSAAEYAIKGQLACRIYSDLEHSTAQLGTLEQYLEDDQNLREVVERQWNGFRAFLGKQVAEDDKLLWLEVWDLSSGHMYGASSALRSKSGMPLVYDYLPSCARECDNEDWKTCCDQGFEDTFSRKIYGWQKTVQGEDTSGSEWGDYAVNREALRRSRLGAITCGNGDCSEDFVGPKSLWEATTYMGDVSAEGQAAFRVPRVRGLRPSWNIVSAKHAEKLPMVNDLRGAAQVAILTTPLVFSNGSQSSVKMATIGIDTSVFTERAMAAIAVSGVGDPKINDFTDSGYSLSDGGCFGLVDLTTSAVVGGDRRSQGSIKANSWKHSSVFPSQSHFGPSPNYHPVDLCEREKLKEFAEVSQRTVHEYSEHATEDADIYSAKFRRVIPGSLSFWPVQSDNDPSGASTAAYYRNPFGSDSSAGDAVTAFHVSSLDGWPVEDFQLSALELMKLSAEAANPPSPLGGYSKELELFLPNWGLYLGTPRTKVISYLQQQMIGSIVLTLAVMAASILILLHLAVEAAPPDKRVKNRIFKWFQGFAKKPQKQQEHAKQHDTRKGQSMVLGGLEPHSLLVSLLTFALTMFLTFISSSTWGRATDDVSFRVTECASALASREVEQNAGFRRLATSLAADARDIHFLVASSLFQYNSESEDAFSRETREKRAEYHQSAFLAAQGDKSNFLDVLVSVPSIVIQSEFMKSAASLSFIEVTSTFGHLGIGTDALGGTVWNGGRQGGYAAVQPVTLSTEEMKKRGNLEVDGEGILYANTSRIESAWQEPMIGCLSLLVRSELDPEGMENVVREYVLYPHIVQSSADYVTDSGSARSVSDVDLAVSWHKSVIDLAADLIVIGVVNPTSVAAIDKVQSPPASRKFVEALTQQAMIRTQLVGLTDKPIELPSYPWFSIFEHYSDHPKTPISDSVCEVTGAFPTASPANFRRSLFSGTWTYVYSVWSPEPQRDINMPDAIVSGSHETRTFTLGSRTMSLASGEAHARATNGTLVFRGFERFIATHWEDAMEVIARPNPMHIDGSSRLAENMSVSPDFELFAVYHADFGLSGFNQMLGNVPVHFSTKSPFDNTSPFEIGIDSYDQPHRLVATEGPLRAMHSVDAGQVSVPRYLGFSTAHDPSLVDGFSFGNAAGALQETTTQLQATLCSDTGCVTNFPQRRTSESPLFSSAGSKPNRFDAIVRPASILLGSSHGGVLQEDSENGAFERMFVRGSDDVYVRTAALEIANDIDFFQYAADATSVMQTVAQLAGLTSPESKRTALFGAGVHAEYINSRHVIGGASGTGMVIRLCSNQSSGTTVGTENMDAFVGTMLSNSLRMGNDLDVVSSGLVHWQTIKRESISWQWALFLIALGPLLAATLLSGILTTKLRRYYKRLMKPPQRASSSKSIMSASSKGTNSFRNNSNCSFSDRASLRKWKRASLLWKASRKVMGQAASSEPPDTSESHTLRVQTDDASKPLIPRDPAIEAAMRAVHQHVSSVYARNSLWDAWQYSDIQEAARLKHDGPRDSKERMWMWISRLWSPRLDSEHVRNPLAGLSEEVQRDVLDNRRKDENSMSQNNPMANHKKSLFSSHKTVSSTADICWENSLFRRAREFIHMYSSDRHALEVVILDREGRFKAETFHRLFYTTAYTSFVYLVVAALLLLAFFEASGTVVEGGQLDDASVVVAMPSSGGEYANILPSDAPNTSPQDIEVEIGIGLEGAGQLPVEQSVDGREGWTAVNAGAWGTFSASRPAELVSKLRSQLLLAEFFILLLLGLDNLLFVYAKGVRKKFKSLYSKKAARSSIVSQAGEGTIGGSIGYESKRGTTRGGSLEARMVNGGNTNEEAKQFASEATVSNNPLNVLKSDKDGLAENRNASERLSIANSRAKKSSTYHKLFIVRLILFTGILLDFLVRLGVDYRTGRSATILPVTVLIRPVYAILRIPALRRSIQALGSTFLLARRTFTLFIVFTIVIASLSIALFSDYTDLGDDPVGGEPPNPMQSFPFASRDEAVALEDNTDFQLFRTQSKAVSVAGSNPGIAPYQTEEFALPALGRGFTNFQSSWYTIFILSATGENYDDITYPDRDPADDGGFLGGFYRPYLVILSLLGMFIMSALLLVSFQSRFSESYDHRARRVTRRRRFAPLVAFSMLDLDGNGFIDRYEYEGFFSGVQHKESSLRRPQ
eukprot:gb/GECG01012034.1/.p1 GENE.gb/GECG01012034.1/~~gb/GECG01012034.1/.p1  ORF type:complete len:2252 (+),score=216.81 gb/GECG01012034.1/:1-6756(+)